MILYKNRHPFIHTLEIHALSSRPQVTYKKKEKMDGTLLVPKMKLTLCACKDTNTKTIAHWPNLTICALAGDTAHKYLDKMFIKK